MEFGFKEIAALVVVFVLFLYVIIDKIRRERKMIKIRKECQHNEWIYLRKCKKCGKIEVIDNGKKIDPKDIDIDAGGLLMNF